MVRTVLIADDHPLFRDALRLAVLQADPFAITRDADSAAALFAILASGPAADMLLLDLRMPDSQGFSTLLRVRAEQPALPVIVVTAEESSDVIARARAYGAAGYIVKSARLSEISQVIGKALHGEPLDAHWPQGIDDRDPDRLAERIASLSPTQLKVLLAVLDGRLNKQIAYDLNVSEVTIKAHMTAVFRKLNVINRTQAVLAAQALGLSARMPIAAQ